MSETLTLEAIVFQTIQELLPTFDGHILSVAKFDSDLLDGLNLAFETVNLTTERSVELSETARKSFSAAGLFANIFILSSPLPLSFCKNIKIGWKKGWTREMNDEIKKKALEKLDKDYPEEMYIYRRWERCIKMYQSGFWAVPSSINATLDSINDTLPGEKLSVMENIGEGMQMVNLIYQGVSDKWIRDIIRSTYAPKEYVFLELLLKINPLTEQQRLEAARADFAKREERNAPEFYTRFYDIDKATLHEWEATAPDVPTSPNPILRPVTETRSAAIEELTKRHPVEQGTFHDMDESLEFYEMGCMDAISAVVKKWIDERCTDEVRKLLEYFKDFIRTGIPIEKIRGNFISSVPENVRPLFEFFLECSEAGRDMNDEGK